MLLHMKWKKATSSCDGGTVCLRGLINKAVMYTATTNKDVAQELNIFPADLALRHLGNFMSVTDVYHRFDWNVWESPYIQWLTPVTDAQFSEIAHLPEPCPDLGYVWLLTTSTESQKTLNFFHDPNFESKSRWGLLLKDSLICFNYCFIQLCDNIYSC